jgi:hypothetical protein
VREPSSADPIGESAKTNQVFRAAQGDVQAGFVEGAITADGPAMVTAFKVTQTPPLIVAVSLDRSELLADWRRQAIGSAMFFVVLGLTMTGTLQVLFRQTDATHAAERELLRAQQAGRIS